jgi:hypothetical protein
MKAVRLIKMCLKENFSKNSASNILSDTFPIQTGLKQKDDLSRGLQGEDGGSTALRNVNTLSHNNIRHHNKEDLDLNLHHRENLRSWQEDVLYSFLYNFALEYAIRNSQEIRRDRN